MDINLTPSNEYLKKYTNNFKGIKFRLGFNYTFFGMNIFYEYGASTINPNIKIEDYIFNKISSRTAGSEIYLNYPLFLPFINLKYPALILGTGFGTGRLVLPDYKDVYYANNNYFIILGMDLKVYDFLISFQYKKTFNLFNRPVTTGDTSDEGDKNRLDSRTQWQTISMGVGYAINLQSIF